MPSEIERTNVRGGGGGGGRERYLKKKSTEKFWDGVGRGRAFGGGWGSTSFSKPAAGRGGRLNVWEVAGGRRIISGNIGKIFHVNLRTRGILILEHSEYYHRLFGRAGKARPRAGV